MTLPPQLRKAIDDLFDHRSQRDLAERAEKMSERYREFERSSSRYPLHLTGDDVLAYAATRLPATFAACAHTFLDIGELAPDFKPKTLLDLGCGPGTVMWAAAAHWPTINQADLIDSNSNFIALGQKLVEDGRNDTLVRWHHASAIEAIGEANAADLVVASYLLAEHQSSNFEMVVDKMWQSTNGIIVFIEPGTPRGYERLMAARKQLITSGAFTVAPCPHDEPCPLMDNDWCHFSVRLPRSKLHRTIKRSERSFEDEKFSYIALAREPFTRGYARVIKPPQMTKGNIEIELCQGQGLKTKRVLRRNRADYQAARKLRWGDTIRAASNR